MNRNDSTGNYSIDKIGGTDYYSTSKPGTEGEETSAEIDRLLTVPEVCELLYRVPVYYRWEQST